MSTPEEQSQHSVGSALLDLLAPVTAVRSYVIVFCLTTIVSSLALTYMYSEKYMAATTILFRPQEVTRIRQKEALAFGAPLPAPPFDLIYDNLQLLVQSEPILFPVIYELGLHLEEPKVYEGPPLMQLFERTKDRLKQLRDDTWTILKHGRLVSDDPATAALKGVRKHLSLINHNSYVFYLSFIDKEPKRAAIIVDKIAEKVVESLLKDQQGPGIERGEQLGQLRDAKEAEIADYQQQIADLMLDNDIASISEEIERSMARYSELKLEQVQLKSRLAGSRAKLSGITEHLTNAEGNLQPDDYRSLRSERIAAEIDVKAVAEQYEEVRAAVINLKSRLQRLPEIQHQHDALLQNLRTAQRDLVQISDPYLEAKVQANSVLSEAVVAHKARVPSIPISPVKVYHVGLAGGLAITISFGVAYLLAFIGSDQVAAAVSRTVSNVVGMWDGVNRRQGDRRRPNPPPYHGPERRRAVDRRGGSADDRRGGSAADRRGGSADDRRGGSADERRGGSADDRRGGSAADRKSD